MLPVQCVSEAARSWKPRQPRQPRAGGFKRTLKLVFVASVFVVMLSAAVLNGIQDVNIEFEGDTITLKVSLVDYTCLTSELPGSAEQHAQIAHISKVQRRSLGSVEGYQ